MAKAPLTSSTDAFRLTFSATTSYLVVRWSGLQGFANLGRALAEVTARAREHQKRRLLFDFRFTVGQVATYDVSQLGRLGADSLRGFRVAFLIDPQRHTGLLARSVRAAGVDCAGFTDQDAAVQWLQEAPAGP